MSRLTVTKLVCEYRGNPLGIDVTRPRLGWQLHSERRGVAQSAYRILAASDPGLLKEGEADLWDSGRLESDRSIHVPYRGEPLRSRQRVYWQVTVWDERGEAGTGEAAWFEMGLLDASDWHGSWISASLAGGARSSIPVPFFRKPFHLPKAVTSARLYATALGLYECSINGVTVGDLVFAPGWTDYHRQVRYQVYDVTQLLRAGDNVLGALLGDGWAAGFVGMSNRQAYVDKPRLLAQLEVTLEDGSSHVVVSDGSWKHQFGPLLESDLIMGEAYDARLELPGWDAPAYDDRAWLDVACFEHPEVSLVASNGPMIRRMAERTTEAPIATVNHLFKKIDIVDLGQNMVGRVRFKGSAPRGTTIIVRFAEVLDEDGGIYTDNLRSATATDVYTFKGEGEEVWETRFTFHGFRYVEIQDYPGDVTPDTVTGVVLYSDMPQTGHFACSDALIDRLQSNIVWGQRGNFLDVPTDCPQRDERLGWTGDIQVFVRTAAFNMDVAGFMTKWAKDLRDAQTERGAVPAVVPHAGLRLSDGGPAWSDAAVICPWTIYLCYGDKAILEENYDVMTRFMEFMLEESPGYVRCAPDYQGWMGFGDWLSLNADTPRDLIGTAFLAYDAGLMARVADVLGRAEDGAGYRKLFEDVKKVFQDRYLHGGSLTDDDVRAYRERQAVQMADSVSRGNLERVDYGPIASEVFNTELFTPTQTAFVLGLHFDLFPEKLIPVAVEELVADIERRGMHLSTGFVGTSYLPHALSDRGELDTVYTLLQQRSWPSWLYAVTQGATTIWERWDGWTEERGFQSAQMNSFNHYAYGAIGSWLYQTVAGLDLDPRQPGYKHSFIRPRPGGGLHYAEASIDTPYGKLASRWEQDDTGLEVDIEVPANTTATVTLPGSSATEGGRPLESLEGIGKVEREPGSISFDVASGRYSFRTH